MLLLIPNLLCWGWWILVPNQRPRWLNWLPGLAGLLLIAQLLIEGYHWQLVPAYALTVLVFGLTLLGRARSGQSIRRRAASIAIGVLGILLTSVVALPSLLLHHSFGKNLIDTQDGLTKVAALLGHSNLNTTRG